MLRATSRHCVERKRMRGKGGTGGKGGKGERGGRKLECVVKGEEEMH